METREVSLVEEKQKRLEFAEEPPKNADLLNDALLTVGGHPVCLHTKLEAPLDLTERLRRFLRAFNGWLSKPPKKAGAVLVPSRVSGIFHPNITFGFQAPSPMRRRWGPTVSLTNIRYPKLAVMLEELADHSWRQFEQTLPDLANEHIDRTSGIPNNWRMGETKGWSSGVLNRTSALPYHHDRSNVAGSWSAMVVIRSQIEGGHLHIPKMDSYLACEDLSLSIFDGQSTLHGVTPFTRHPGEGYRYSIVFYAKNGLVGARTPEEELRKSQIRASR